MLGAYTADNNIDVEELLDSISRVLGKDRFRAAVSQFDELGSSGYFLPLAHSP